MDPRLLRYYNQELRYLREQGAEFAREFPKIASRLGLEGLEVADPYVERLLEGSAFLAARVQLKQDAEFPRLSQRLLEMIYPSFLAPVPAMVVAQFQPKDDPNLLKGLSLPRGSVLHGARSPASDTRCEFRTAQPVTLTPLSTLSAEYFTSAADLSLATLPLAERARSGVRVRLKLPPGMDITQLQVGSLRFHLGGQSDIALRLYELMTASCLGVLVGPPGRAGDGARRLLEAEALQAVGFDDEQAMLPVTLRGLAGTRLMQEYFAFPQRFLFFDLNGLAPCFAACKGDTIEIVLLFSRPGQGLEGAVEAANYSLHCAPAVNLFPKRADRVQLNESSNEFHVVAERSAPLDYEVHSIVGVSGHDAQNREQVFHAFYAAPQGAPAGSQGYYTVAREPRLVSDKMRRDGPRSGYIGSEVFVSLVDPKEAPFPEALRELSVVTLCTNRDLPVFMPLGGAEGDFQLDGGAPVTAVRCVAGPSRPHSSLREGGFAWRLLNLLSLNYLSLLDTDPEQGAVALRELLGHFVPANDAGMKRQVEGVQKVGVRPIVRRHPIPGPIAFGRGIEVTVTVDELGFEGGSAMLLGSVLHRYLSRHVSLNSYVETVLASLTRGELMRWKPGRGARPVA
ncbi:MAG: type VI secretion system baseplate subunit TssF [Aquabacterium sp.]|jgi:type VI secretion system protein ImpG|nr:MAG: type VI secretion system baseplate subunit TssF [Aquabacterium sp.]